jgi:streptomycin 6-kinase
VVEVPEPVRRKAVDAGATGWLEALPGLGADLAREWSLEIGRIYPDATEALVADARLEGTTPAVLKLVIPRDGAADAARNEATVLRLAGGDGCARLLREDLTRGAMLLERLGPSLHDLHLPVRRRHDILAGAAARVWRPAPDSGLPTGAEKARWLAAHVTSRWEALDHPCSAAAVEHALACAERRLHAHDDARAVLVHGDVHAWNALKSVETVETAAPGEPGGFKLVDPDGLLAEPEYDLGVIAREDPEEYLHGDPARWVRRLARRTGRDAAATWEWAVVERVSTGLICTAIGLQPVGRLLLRAADRIAGLRVDLC